MAEQARISQCEERVARAWSAERPRRLLEAIRSGGCSALPTGGPTDVVTCRICPSGEAWEYVAGYYRAAKQKVYVCAEKEPSQQQVEDTLTHELVHAYDHCRYGMRLPFVGTQAATALLDPRPRPRPLHEPPRPSILTPAFAPTLPSALPSNPSVLHSAL